MALLLKSLWAGFAREEKDRTRSDERCGALKCPRLVDFSFGSNQSVDYVNRVAFSRHEERRGSINCRRLALICSCSNQS
eukprot:1995203-Amphidinium_carterae.1